MASFWDERYGSDDFAYGKMPNAFFKSELEKIGRGKILFPCEGEGRNAVYAAQQAWYVYAFDSSKVARTKAMRLAKENFVQIQYDVCNVASSSYSEAYFDCLGIFFAHFDKEDQLSNYRKMASWLKPGGHIILELFSTQQLDYQKKYDSGGPKKEDMLVTADYIKEFFFDFEIIQIREGEVELNEGPFHQGKASTVRFVGQKLDPSINPSV